MMEGGNSPKSRIMDQIVIDRYLIRGLLTITQHRGGERLLKQAARAGIWPTGVDLSSMSGGGRGRPNYVPFGAFPFGWLLSEVGIRFGSGHARLVREVVCYDRDVSASEPQMDCLRESLDLINNLRGSRGRAYQKLERAVLRGSQQGSFE